MHAPVLLVGDIGGTNARFALANKQTIGFYGEKTFKCAQFSSAETAITEYLEQVNVGRPDVICIAAAGPIVDGQVRFTNNNWSIVSTELASVFDGARIRLLNDFEALAYSLPQLQPQDFCRVGLPPLADLGKANYTVGIVGPGTGLGAAGLIKRNNAIFPIIGEGGHVGFAPETQLQMDILARLRDQFDRVADERLVSGPGVVNIYRALCDIRGEKFSPIDAAKVFSTASLKNDSAAANAVQVFFEVLGQLAGNLALSLGATDGIYIGGGIVARSPELIVNSHFRAGFERKGRHRSLMEKIPTQLILHSQPGLLGAGYCARQMCSVSGPVIR